MADSIRWAVSVTPVEELLDGQDEEHSVIHSDIGKSLGGSGVKDTTNMIYNSSFNVTGDGLASSVQPYNFGGADDDVQVLFIKHLGINSDGDDEDAAVYVSVDDQDSSTIRIPNKEVSLVLSPVKSGQMSQLQDIFFYHDSSIGAGENVTIEILCDAP